MSDKKKDNSPPPDKHGWEAKKPNLTTPPRTTKHAPKLRNKEPAVGKKEKEVMEAEDGLQEDDVLLEEAELVEETPKEKQKWADSRPTARIRSDKTASLLGKKGATDESPQGQEIVKKKKDKDEVNNDGGEPKEKSSSKEKKASKEGKVDKEKKASKEGKLDKEKTSKEGTVEEDGAKKEKKKKSSTEESMPSNNSSSTAVQSNAISMTISPADADHIVTKVLACWKKAINKLEDEYMPRVSNWIVDCHVVLAVVDLDYVPKNLGGNSSSMTSADDMLCEALRYLSQTKSKINGEIQMINEVMAHPKTYLPEGLREQYAALDEKKKADPFLARLMKEGFDKKSSLTGGWRDLWPFLERKVGEKNPTILRKAMNDTITAIYSVDDIYHYNDALGTFKEGSLIKECLAEATIVMAIIDDLAVPRKDFPGEVFDERKAEKIEYMEVTKKKRKAIKSKMDGVTLSKSKDDPMVDVVHHAFKQVATNLRSKKYSNASVTYF